MSLFSDYTQGKTDVANWLNRSDLTSYIPDFIRMGELRIYRDLRLRCMETALSSAISSGVVAVPSGYVELKYAYVNGTPIRSLTKKDAEWIYYNYPTRSADSKPFYIAREADNFIFGPYPDSAYTIKGVYYKKLDALSGSSLTNWFTINAPDLLLFASLTEAKEFIEDDSRIELWERKYQQAADRIRREDEQEEFSGSPLAMTAR